MKNVNPITAVGLGLAAGAAVSLIVMPKKKSLKAKATKAVKTASRIVEGISDSLDAEG